MDDLARARDEFDRALGYLVRSSSRLEMSVRGLFVELLRSPHGPRLAAGEDVGRMLQAIEALVAADVESGRLPAVAGGKITAAIRPLSYKKGLLDRRNSAVHGSWTANPMDPTIRTSRRSRRWKVESDSKVWTVDELRDVGRELTVAAGRISWYAAGVALDAPEHEWLDDDSVRVDDPVTRA